MEALGLTLARKAGRSFPITLNRTTPPPLETHMTPRLSARGLAAAAMMFGLAACEEPTGNTTSMSETTDPSLASAEAEEGLASIMDQTNVALAADGKGYRVALAEYVTKPSGEDFGGTVLAKDVGNKQLSSDFVPNDINREEWSGPVGGGPDNITYAVDQTTDAVPVFGGLSAAQTDAAIVRAMASWEAVNCSDLGLVRNPDFGADIGVIAFINGFGGSPFVFADVQHAGWRDINFAGSILGVTFTFIFVDDQGNPVDQDGNGRTDVAFREIYYDPSFGWADDGVDDTDIDVESVALHEAGHGLSQAHFGKVWLKNDGSLKASPRAVMNALYAAPFRSLAGTDNGGHCSNWAQWPNN